jgi:N-acetylgalactosamine-6-sulfatase
MRATALLPRLFVCAGMVSGSLSAAASGAEESHAEAPRPNILLLVADDLGFGDLACYGHPRIQTPWLDRLAAEGTRFRQFYVSHSVCSPSRSTLLTGQAPSRWQIYAHLSWLFENERRGMPDWLDVRAPSIARALQQAGYHTAIFGKWHLGGGSGRLFRGKPINSAAAPPPAAYGFTESRVFFGNGPTWRGTTPVPAPHEIYPYTDTEFLSHSSSLIADEAIHFLERRAREPAPAPFWLDLCFHAPHVPLAPTDQMRRPYRDVVDPGLRDYYAVVTELGRQVGRVLAKLDELDLRENTLVIFMSDNGAPARAGSLATGRAAGVPTDTGGSNGPLRGWKWHLYEGGIRVPFLVRWPGHVPSGRVDDRSVLTAADLVPTFLRLTGAVMPAGYRPDGVDITPALAGDGFRRATPIYWQNPTAGRRGPVFAIRDGQWKLLVEPDGTDPQLFDLETDEVESRDLAASEPAIVAALWEKVRQWSATLPPPLERAKPSSRP